MPEPFLQFRGVRKCYGKTEALRGIDLDVMSDELLVVLGPTGAGKTTLLRVIAGLETVDGGELMLNRKRTNDDPPATRDVAIVFQNFSLYPDRTVRQNLEFPLKAPGRNLDEYEIHTRIDWASSLLKISHLLDRPANRLSGGEMQRVAIGRAIVRRPKMFLMDEPLSNLDAKLRESLRVELMLLRRELKTPMIFVTHDQAEALSMADRIVVLSEGKILQTGTPEEIYRRPASPIVARQLGQPAINLILSPPDRMMGVRPEDIEPMGGQTEATVKVVEDLGPVQVLLVAWQGRDVHIVTPRQTDFAAGAKIFPKIRMDRAIYWPI